MATNVYSLVSDCYNWRQATERVLRYLRSYDFNGIRYSIAKELEEEFEILEISELRIIHFQIVMERW